MRTLAIIAMGVCITGCDPGETGGSPGDARLVDVAERDVAERDVAERDVAERDAAVGDVFDTRDVVDAAQADVIDVVVDDVPDVARVDPAATGPLRLIAPLSTTIVTSRRPTLRWGPTPDGARAHVTLCADPACTRTLAALDATGTSVRPSALLRPGPVFWRVRVTPSTGEVWESPTWEFFVTPHDSPVDTTRCCVVDVNRDGVPDLPSALFAGGFAAYGGARVEGDELPWSEGVLTSDAIGYEPSLRRPRIAVHVHVGGEGPALRRAAGHQTT